ncbi:MAG: STAS domain-containing protein [Phycisphaerae bacterium]
MPADAVEPDLKLDIRREGAAQVVGLIGAVRLDGAEQLQASLPALVTAAVPNLILDLSRLEFIASVGLAALVAAQRKSRSLRGATYIVNPTPSIAQLLKLTRIDQVIHSFPTLELAQAAMKAPTS